MASQAFVSLDDFHKRRLHLGKPISVYTHELKKLLDQPKSDPVEKEILQALSQSCKKPLWPDMEMSTLESIPPVVVPVERGGSHCLQDCTPNPTGDTVKVPVLAQLLR